MIYFAAERYYMYITFTCTMTATDIYGKTDDNTPSH
jgi:hypothetical protein